MSGAAGHISHPLEDRSMTFGELKDLITRASTGKLESVSEKIDGMNMMFTCSPNGHVRFARNKGDMKSGGMDFMEISTRFAGRGNVEEAFVAAYDVLSSAVQVLQDKDILFMRGKRWFSIEVIYVPAANVINYDSNSIVFHTSPVFETMIDGNVQSIDNTDATWMTGIDVIADSINNMQNALQLKNWKLFGPSVMKLQKLASDKPAQDAIGKIDCAMNEAGVGDRDKIEKYVENVVYDVLTQQGQFPARMLVMIAQRIAEVSRVPGLGVPSLIDIKRTMKNLNYSTLSIDQVSKFVLQQGPILVTKALEPIDSAIRDFSIEMLRGLKSSLVTNPTEEAMRIRAQVEETIEQIRSSGDVRAMEMLEKHIGKLRLDDVSAIEGVCFRYKGRTMKFTGSFSAVNQILGIMRYRR